jgi:hypothetical protein
MKTLFLILILSIGVAAQTTKPKNTWQGLYISAARTVPVDKLKVFKMSDFNFEATAIMGLSKNWSFQTEIIYPIGQTPFLRLAVARRIF